MTKQKRPEDGVRAKPVPPESAPRESEEELRPDAPESDFFDNEEHDGWAPIRRRVEEPENPE